MSLDPTLTHHQLQEAIEKVRIEVLADLAALGCNITPTTLVPVLIPDSICEEEVEEEESPDGVTGEDQQPAMRAEEVWRKKFDKAVKQLPKVVPSLKETDLTSMQRQWLAPRTETMPLGEILDTLSLIHI